MDLWITAAGMLRSFFRGWGANHDSEAKRAREALIEEIKTLDAQADTRVFSEVEWANHYALENQVLSILREEEQYWRRRGGVKWVTKGDANTGYFHEYASGRKHKCSIIRLQADHAVLVCQDEISPRIYDLFLGLLGTAEEKPL
ncbi:Peroxidase [Hordeum vulgare]|nr:Peroxidase [Hordeum vulgare]